jgi:hypothetical protein
MSWSNALQFLFWTALGVAAGVVVVRTYWRLRSDWVRSREGEPPLRSAQAAVWRDPGDVGTRDLATGAGPPPAPPFTFVEEHDSGSQPCVSVHDAARREWRVKWGPEVKAETFGTRLAWVLGFFSEQTHFIAEGVIAGARDLRRAKANIDEHGRFTDARFELSEAGVAKHFDAHSWSWSDNPFVGSRELNGLKILMMLLSNWDNKDVRDVARGSNTAIFEHRLTDGSLEARYLIIDWGAALGAWGNNIVQRGRWDPEAYAAQNEQFVTGMEGDVVHWGYQGQRTADLTYDITREDVQWFVRLAGRLSDDQLRAGFLASGADAEEANRFTAAIRGRIDALRKIAQPPAAARRIHS